MPVTGSFRVIEGRGVTTQIASLKREVNARTRASRRYIGTEVVAALQSTNRTLVNVDTGLMRDNFRFRAPNSSRRVDILNRAQSRGGYFYPQKIEREYRGIARTIRRERSTIVSNVNSRLRQNPNGPDSLLPNEIR